MRETEKEVSEWGASPMGQEILTLGEDIVYAIKYMNLSDFKVVFQLFIVLFFILYFFISIKRSDQIWQIYAKTLKAKATVGLLRHLTVFYNL